MPRPGLFLVATATSGLLLFAGCTTSSPQTALPAVQQHLTARGDFNVAWPQTGDERAAADRAVDVLLTSELTVETAVQIALLNNRHLRATFEDLGVSQADLASASRLHNPIFAASVRWPDRTPRGPNVELSLVADLLDDLLIPLRKKFASEQLAQAERLVAHDVLALAAEVQTAVYTAQARQLFSARLAGIADVNAAAADLAQRQFDAGNINQLELAQLQVAAQQSKLTLTRTEAQFRGDREKVTRLLGLGSQQTAWKLSVILPVLPAEENGLDQLEDLAVHQRLDLAAAHTRVARAASAFELKRKTRLLPVGLRVGVDTERESQGDRLTGPRVEIGLPIFDQGQAELARLASDHRRAMANYEALATEVRSEVREAREALLTARATAETYAKILLPQRQLILRETQLHYNAMQKSSYDLLAAREQQLLVERESIEALRDYWIARVQLERAVGGRLGALPTIPLPPKTSGPETSEAVHSHR